MGKNVLILGAGFSFDAGIPLLGNFVECMMDIWLAKSHDGQPITSEQDLILGKALEVRGYLSKYHARANFDERNIEDILSLLNFEKIAGLEGADERMNDMVKAISTTIGITCKQKFEGPLYRFNHHQSIDSLENYEKFWASLFELKRQGKELPCIITFNYDLVLENSLFRLLNSPYYGQGAQDLPFHYFKIAYHNKMSKDVIYKVSRHSEIRPEISGNMWRGAKTEDAKTDGASELTEIEILKLHGSLNFSSDLGSAAHPTIVSDEPFILPPVFNKMSDSVNSAWATALTRLREAQNIIILGYSLPSSDIYMQYFLKSAVGPNQDLRRIFVFNPTLHKNNQDASDLKARYLSCFSRQFQKYLMFSNPFASMSPTRPEEGSTAHFIHLLRWEPAKIFF